MRTALPVVWLLAAACGGATRSDPASEPLESARGNQPHDVRHAEHAGHGGPPAAPADDEMAGVPAEIQAFHATLAPRWHAEHGPARMADTCAAVPTLRGQADAIGKAAPPQGASATAWTERTRQLGGAVAALNETCQAKDAAGFETAFGELHLRFHAVLELGGEHHAEHGADGH